ncbi:hypothetical protein CYMTET_35476, partial [Cymbomonas tetramitiformis]
PETTSSDRYFSWWFKRTLLQVADDLERNGTRIATDALLAVRQSQAFRNESVTDEMRTEASREWTRALKGLALWHLLEMEAEGQQLHLRHLRITAEVQRREPSTVAACG